MPVIPVLPSGSSAIEIAAQRNQTNAFIAARPSLIALIPRVRSKTGSGVRWQDQAPRPLQVVRLIEQNLDSSIFGSSEQGDDGKQRKVSFQMLLPWDGQVGLYDYWVDNEGIRNEVTNLLPFNGYERRAEVIRYGETG
jgi:hypothetical protein